MSAADQEALNCAIIANDGIAFQAIYRQVNLNERLEQAQTQPLMLAVLHRRYEMLVALVNHPIKVQPQIMARAFIEAIDLKDAQAEACMENAVDLNAALEMAAQRGWEDKIEALLSRGAALENNDGLAVILAARGHHRPLAQCLLERMDRSQSATAMAGTEVASAALKVEDFEAVAKALIYADVPASPPNAVSELMNTFAGKGNVSVMIFLLARLDNYSPERKKEACDNAFLTAVACGDESMVNALLPVSDPNAQMCKALRTALLNDNESMAALLAPHCDVEQARKGFSVGSPRRVAMINALAGLAPEKIRQKWFKKDPAGFAVAIAIDRQKRAHREEDLETLTTQRRQRARP
jgi:ankyrin repeat protein